ncbi:MAG: hypothetical protein LBL59_06530 [Xanthomonadaceae bacterium]|nr:hypothetical protein [Xanthomonadaceae bacterium]
MNETRPAPLFDSMPVRRLKRPRWVSITTPLRPDTPPIASTVAMKCGSLALMKPTSTGSNREPQDSLV